MSDINCKSVFGSAVVRRTFLAAAGVLLAGPVLAEAYVPGAGGIDVRLYQTTAAKGFRELPTAEFTIHPYPAALAVVGCRGVSGAVPHLRRLCESNRQENNKQENNKQERNGT